MKAVILCAGLGTRLRPITNTIPKVMVEIGEKPLLQHHIEWLVGQGIRDIGINLFYLPKIITDFIGDGSKFGAKIYYSRQETLSETATGFKKFKEFVGNEKCIVIYGDNFFKLDLKDFEKFHNEKGGIMSIALKHWDNPTAKGIVELDENERIISFKEKPKSDEVTTDLGNAGIYMLNPEIFSHIGDDKDYDFSKDIFPNLLLKEKMYGYSLSEYHEDIGTMETLEKTRNDYASLYPNKAIFLDRDGVLNKKPPSHDYVKSTEEFVWNTEAKDLIKKIKSLGYFAIVISNQQGIAKDEMTKEFVEKLHEKMNDDLKVIGAQIDDFYYCPHLNNDDCTCRKPKPGLLFKAKEKYKIDLRKSFLIGDSKSDMETAKRAGCKEILVETDKINLGSITNII